MDAGANFTKEDFVEKVMAQRRVKSEELKKRLKAKSRNKRQSGVVYADAIAEMKRSGEIKGDVKPRQAKRIIAKMIRERVLDKLKGKNDI